MATSTSSTRYLSGHPIWFELNADDEIENDDASIGAEKKNLTMTRIIDHMKRNRVEYAKLNVRTNPKSMKSVRLYLFSCVSKYLLFKRDRYEIS